VDLPTDRPRGAAVSGTGDTVYVTIPRAVREAVEALARARHTTPFSVVAAAFARWLAERARVSDVVLVVGYANRQRLEFESMLSFTTVGLAVPLAVGEAGTFGELVGRTAVGVMAAIDNAVPVSRVLPDPPNVLMVFVYDVQDSVRFTGLETVAVDDVAPMASRREMTWGIVQSEDIAKGYQVWLEYSSDLWNRDSALVMVRDYALSLEVSCAESRAT
jgi:iturin family lipopeptide synthetase A